VECIQFHQICLGSQFPHHNDKMPGYTGHQTGIGAHPLGMGNPVMP